MTKQALCSVGRNTTNGGCRGPAVDRDMCRKHAKQHDEIMRLTSWDDCVVSGCDLEYGHSGPHAL